MPHSPKHPAFVLPPLQHWINGTWTAAPDSSHRNIINPATQECIARVPQCTPEELDRVIQAATDAFPLWSKKTAFERGHIIKKWQSLITHHIDNLSRVLSAEQGKPIAEARSELLGSASYLEWSAEEARRHYGDIVPPTQSDKRMLVFRQPIGVVGAITPWNFPGGMILRKVAPALASGCTVILKPASQTPLTALALIQLSEEAGFPHGVLNLIMGQAEGIGRTFSTDPRVQKISFTGSTRVGQTLLEWAAPHLKRLSMELGGNAPFIIFEDAHLESALDGIMFSKFRNAGQTCVCANRLYVHRKHYPAAIEALTQRIRSLRLGHGDWPDTQIGPLIDAAAIQRSLSIIEEATQAGAQLLVGGKQRTDLGALFFEPALLTHVNSSMRVVKEELFAPILPVMAFDSDEEVIQEANATPYGLAAYFYSENMKRIMHVSEALQFGIVGVNTPYASNESVPFGGVKYSGLGREGSKHGLDDYTELKTVCLAGI
jgi:succinate-semialdehyde dehydrogenase / glutarate-semialdehyde dehydrogenase